MWRDNMFQAGKSEYLWSSGALHKIKKKKKTIGLSTVQHWFIILT